MSYAMNALSASNTYPLEPVIGSGKLKLFFRRFIEEYYQTQDEIDGFLSIKSLRAASDVLMSQSVELTIMLDSQGNRLPVPKDKEPGFVLLLPVWNSGDLSFKPRLTIMTVSKDRQRVIEGEAEGFPILHVVPQDFLEQAENLTNRQSPQGRKLMFDENLIAQLNYYRRLLGLLSLTDKTLFA